MRAVSEYGGLTCGGCDSLMAYADIPSCCVYFVDPMDGFLIGQC